METTKKHWKQEFNYEYLGAQDLPGGKNVILTIAGFGRKDVKDQNGKTENCFICMFKEKGVKPMVLNKTNCKTLQRIFATPYEVEWIGRNIELTTEKVKAFGDVVDALRIVPKIPKLTKPTLEKGTDAYANVLKYLTNEGATIDSVKLKYSLTKQIEEDLKNGK